MIKNTAAISCLVSILFLLQLPAVQAIEAESLVADSFNYMRGKSSVATVIMTIHRPSWERKMTIKAWTRGQKDSLFYIEAPPKDHGNGTLKRGGEMWMYNPKINRIIKVPPSMMSQSWMGSDFSNNDLAKSDSLLTDYTHAIVGTETHDGQRVYLIKSMPKPNAPVVWGMQNLKIRADLIWLSEKFYDEDLQPVKVMTTLEIQMLGGKLYPRVWRMREVDETEKYTELTYTSLEFKPSLPDSLFSQTSLRKARR